MHGRISMLSGIPIGVIKAGNFQGAFKKHTDFLTGIVAGLFDSYIGKSYDNFSYKL